MALTFLPAELVIESDASITDLPAFHAALRDWEDGEGAAIYPVTHTYKVIDLGGGAFFPAVALINGWRLRFPLAGSYLINGNLKGDVIPVAGVYLERQTSAAYATTSAGAVSSPVLDDVHAMMTTLIDSMNGCGGKGLVLIRRR